MAQWCLTLCDPMDYSPPGSFVMRFFRQGYWSGLPFPSSGVVFLNYETFVFYQIIKLTCVFWASQLLHGKESICQHRKCNKCRFDPWFKMIPWRKKWQPSPVFLPGQRSLVSYSPWSRKELDMTEHTHYCVFYSLEQLFVFIFSFFFCFQSCPSLEQEEIDDYICLVNY